MGGQLDQNLWRALSLDERLAVLRTARPLAPGDDARLDRWRSVYGDAETFARRLSWTNTSIEIARAAVAAHPPAELPPAALRTTPTAAMAWVDTRDNLIAALRGAPAAPPESGWHDIPFVHLWTGVLPYAQRRLRAGVAAHAGSLLTAPFVAGLNRLLLLRLSQLSAPVLYDGFSRQRRPGSRLEAFAATPSTAAYMRYVDALRADGASALWAAYPVLARLMAHAVDCWVDGSAALLRRLATDLDTVAATFHDGGHLGDVVAFSAPLSDPHAGHQVVCRLEFACGLALAYKPRSLAMEAALGSVTTWLAMRGVEAGLAPRVLTRDGYGWMAWMATRPCVSPAEHRRYYRRVGALLGLLHLLRGTDAHVDNLVTHGEWPVLVDAETLGQSEGLQAEPAAADDASLTLAPTVLRTGLLPGWHDADKGPGRDVSALGAIPRAHDQAGEWDAVNTDGMAPARVADPRPTSSVPPRPHEYLSSIDEGFTAAYHALVDGRRDLFGAGAPLAEIDRHRSRFVFRPTHVYDQLRRASLAPAAMADGVTRSLLFERLRVPFARFSARTPHWDVVTGEITQLEGHDVPYFTAAGQTPAVDGGVASPVPVLRRSPIDELRAAFETAGPEDLALQRVLLQGALLAHAARVDVAPSVEIDTAPASDSPDALAAAAITIAEQLVNRARHDERLGTYWLGPRFAPTTGRFAFHASGESLFEGAMGTALFLHACDWSTGTARFGALGDQSLQALRRYLDVADTASSEWFARRLGIGGAFGLGSLVYGFVVLAAITRRAADLEHACAAARLITPSAVDRDRQLDVTGGAAGAILALLVLHEATGYDWCLETASRCGHHLISQARLQPAGGLGWITTASAPIAGFAHGGAGIALALSRLASATGESTFADAARAGLEDDDRWLAAQTGARPGQWCRGVAGDGLARIGIADTRARQLLAPADETPADHLDSLCCGLAGRIDAWLVAAQVYDEPRWRAAARRSAAALAARAGQHALRCVPPLDTALLHPGLFQGVAGVGWTLLRSSGAALPSLLRWEFPTSTRLSNRDTMSPEEMK